MNLHDDSAVEGWDLGETRLGQYVAIDREARDIRFLPRGTYYSRSYGYDDVIDVESIAAFAAEAQAREREEPPRELAESISQALDRTDFNEVRRLRRIFDELNSGFVGSYESLELREGREEAEFDPVGTILRAKDGHHRLLEEVDRSGLLAVLVEHGELIREYPLPPLDWVAHDRFDQRMRLEDMYFTARERPELPADGGRSTLERIDEGAIVDGIRADEAEKSPDPGARSRRRRRRCRNLDLHRPERCIRRPQGSSNGSGESLSRGGATHSLRLMAERLLGTGVELRLVRDEGGWLELVGREDPLEARRQEAELGQGLIVLVESQVFADLEDDDRRFRMGGTVSGAFEVSLNADPTNELLRIAEAAREGQRGDLLGDLRIGGSDTTRWEFYAAPFRIELGDDLRERLRDSGLSI